MTILEVVLLVIALVAVAAALFYWSEALYWRLFAEDQLLKRERHAEEIAELLGALDVEVTEDGPRLRAVDDA